MKLTKKLVYKIGYELWMWMAENPSRKKIDWPGWEKYGWMHRDCPCCEYKMWNKITYCCDCIAISIWGGSGCCSDKSPYNLFRISKTKEDRLKYALIIAQGFKRLMEKGS
jgi:hypothetical protein